MSQASNRAGNKLYDVNKGIAHCIVCPGALLASVYHRESVGVGSWWRAGDRGGGGKPPGNETNIDGES